MSKIALSALKEFCRQALEKEGMSAENAEITARVPVSYTHLRAVYVYLPQNARRPDAYVCVL